MRRRGFGLVEMMFVLALMSGILTLLYLIFHQQSSGAKRLDAHQEALRAGLFALEQIGRDLRELVTVPPEPGPDGQPQRRFGDHRTPVRISPTGQEIAFLVPSDRPREPGTAVLECEPVNYALVPSATRGVFAVRRSQGGKAHRVERELPEVRVRDLRFRLLEPFHPDAARRSPDSGYYVEIMLEAVDREDRQVRPLPSLVRLDFPSREAELHGMETRVAYRAPDPLEVAPPRMQVTPRESQLVAALRDLARRFEDGKLSAKEFEKAVREQMASMAGRFAGARVRGTGARVPNFAELTLKAHEPGQPIDLSDPFGNLLSLATTEQAPPPSRPGSAWWVDLAHDDGPGMMAEIADAAGTNSFGPLAGDASNAVTAGAPTPSVTAASPALRQLQQRLAGTP